MGSICVLRFSENVGWVVIWRALNTHPNCFRLVVGYRRRVLFRHGENMARAFTHAIFATFVNRYLCLDTLNFCI